MDLAKSSETVVPFRVTVWHHNPEDRDLNFHRRENLSHRIFLQVCFHIYDALLVSSS